MMLISRFSITYMRQVVGGLALSACLTLLAASEALASFSFTKIADTRSNFTSVSPGAAINDSGTVAFFATSNAGNQGIYTSSGGTITEIANTGNLPSLFDSPNASPSFFSFDQTLNINNNGTVAFLGIENVASAALTRVFTSLDGSITTRATAFFASGGNIIRMFDLNDKEEIAYLRMNPGRASNFAQDYTLSIARPNQPDINVATAFISNTSPLRTGDLSFIGDFAIDNQSQVTISAKRGQEDSLSPAIFRGNGGSLTTKVNTDASELDVSDNGDVVLSNSNAIRLFNNALSTLTTIADTSGGFNTFSNAAINNSGSVAFGASLAANGQGIFIGPDPVVDKVITTGDRLNGSTVTNLSFSKKGLNNHHQIVFYAELADGTRGIFQAFEATNSGS